MDIVFLSGRDMPRPETETSAVVEVLAGYGVEAVVLPWDATPAGGWSAVPLVVVRSTWDYTDDRDAFLFVLGQIDAETTLVNPLGILRWSSHKRYLLDLERAGVPVVPTVVFEAGQVFGAGDFIVKPAVGAGARGASKAAGADVQSVAAGIRGDVLVQPFVTSVPTRGEVSLVFLGGELSHAVRKLPAAGDYRVQAYLGGTVVDHVPTDQEQAVAEAALREAPGELTYARVDLVETDAGPAVMELELVEPELFLRADDPRRRFADVLTDRLRRR